MKKTRFLVLALAVAVMMMGAGYAWWSETLVVDTQVTTGELNVAFDGVVTSADRDVGLPAATFDTVLGAERANIKFLNMYPGANGKAEIYIKNTGTVAVKVDSPILGYEDADAGGLSLIDIFQFNDVTFTPILPNGANGQPTVLTRRDGVLGTLSFTFDETNPVYIYPNDVAKFTVNVHMKESVTSEEGLNDIQFTFSPSFKQFNAPN